MAENDIDTDSIRDYLVRQGGKARNSDVVLHFKEYLNYPDPKKKEYYRQKFKEYINVVAVKKDENGTKYLVLKKKYRETVDSKSSPRQRRIGHPHEYEQGPLEMSPKRSEEDRWRQQVARQEEEERRHADSLRQTARLERERRLAEDRKAAQKKREEQDRLEERLKDERIQEGLRQQEEQRRQREKELFDKKMQEEFPKNPIVIVEPSGEDDTGSPQGYTGPAEQTDVLRSVEGERIIEEKAQISSVTDQVQIINKSFETEKSPKSRRKGLQKSISENSNSTLNKDTLSSSESQASLRSTISGPERLWILYSAQNDLANLSLLLNDNKDLASSKDFINGWTAMHWGAKHGRKEMIRLVANSGMDINTQSHAGYTPLHIAAMYNREAVMQFLTSEYEADVNMRDYSGKRPHQYLTNTEQTYLQQYLTKPSSGVLPNIKVGHLEKFEAQEKRSSKFGSLRASFRALRTWGSTESIPKRRTLSTGVSNSAPKMRPKSLHVEHHRVFTPDTSPTTRHKALITNESDRLRMPPPPAPTHVKRTKTTSAGVQPGDFHKSGSDSNILATATYI